ncbi:MAG: hypothetical protein H8E73_06900 [Planctomycetes bacterium]|nr:hypothetical protein [Planctomycetota bacterium]MBL7186501.1 hypothetical protein [Phycisphaerae bacterium]
MTNFHEGYSKFCRGWHVSGELRPLLARVYNLIHTSPVDLHALKEAVVSLMSFLCEAANRTDANCRAVDLFFMIDDHWSVRWGNLPHDFGGLLDDIGGALHDTVSAPAIAEDFASTPEQLRDRAKRLAV